MADIIQLLPDHVANQIAAGEVVQRPASVVKELLENAVDAQATLIKLIIKDAGKTLIQVVDNGIGMTPTDARLSFERHATSKIRSADDLFSLQTKGFRGEAMASIAAIAHVELKTKPEDTDIGTAILVEGSTVVSQEVVVTPKGTSVAVKNLFFNIPARRNFLKSNTVEMRHIMDEFHRVALAHSQIAFVMLQNGSEVFNLPTGHFRQRIVNILGNKTNEKLVPVEETTEVLTISGFICKPEFARKTRGEQFFFVNQRYIKSAYLNHAVVAAFEGLIKDGKHPSYFLNLEVQPQTIDINIHPTKTEIKFNDEHTLYALLRAAVKHSLGQFNIAPALDFDRDPNLDTPYNYKEKKAIIPTVEVDRNFNPFKTEMSSSKEKKFNFERHKVAPAWESLYIDRASKGNNQPTDFDETQVEQHLSISDISGALEASQELTRRDTVYQLHNKYIISTIKSGMLVIHQNRAHQRVLYEDLLKQLTLKENVSQQLLFPVSLHFSPQDIVILKSLKTDLEQTGFVFNRIEKELVEISGVPLNVPHSEVSIILEQLISDVENRVPESHFSAADLLAKSLAKSLAIKTGQSLTHKEQEHLINSLFACKEPNVTPTLKKIFIAMDIDAIDKKFI